MNLPRRALHLIKRIGMEIYRNLDSVAYARAIGVRIGKDCRILAGSTFGSEPYLITIGNHVTITSGVRFITHDGGVWVFRDKHPQIDRFSPIRVGNNVFIGVDSIILPGVTIGDNCIIGVGSVVARDIPSGSVAAGVPCRVIKTVDAYYEKVFPDCMHIRDLPPDEKKRLLLEHFKLK